MNARAMARKAAYEQLREYTYGTAKRAADAASDIWEPIVRGLLESGYLDDNDETGDKWCHFCGGSYLGSPNIFAKFDESKMHHDDNCAYLRAEEALGE